MADLRSTRVFGELTVMHNATVQGNLTVAGILEVASITGKSSSADVLATARTLKIGNSSKTFNGSANVAWTLAEIGAAAATTSIVAGTGLTGGGTLADNRTLNVAYGTTANTAAQGNDSRINNGQTAFGWGNHASAGYVKTDTTYTAGNGLTLSGTAFSLPVTLSGSGTFVKSVAQTASGITVTLGTPPNTNTTYAEITAAEVTAGTAATLRTISGRRLKQAVDEHGLKIGTTATTAKAGNWVPSWNDVTSKPATATRWPTFAEVTGKPTTFPPSGHTHTIDQVSGLQGAIDAKVNVSGDQTISGTKDFNGVLRATAGSNATSATSGSLRSSGGLGVALDIFAGGNVTAYSDVRRKKDIVTIDGALDIILKARGVYYTRKDTGVKEVGFIAQEMQKILPRVIGGTEENGLGISYGNITAVLAEAVKTVYNDHVSPAKEKIAQLEDQNQKLIERLERLEVLVSEKILNEE